MQSKVHGQKDTRANRLQIMGRATPNDPGSKLYAIYFFTARAAHLDSHEDHNAHEEGVEGLGDKATLESRGVRDCVCAYAYAYACAYAEVGLRGKDRVAHCYCRPSQIRHEQMKDVVDECRDADVSHL